MIIVNGKETETPKTVTMEEYLKGKHYRINQIAVELNHEILPKSRYASTMLKDGDVIEIVSFVGGG